MINAGWFSGDGMNLVLAVALAYGGTAQIIADVMELPRGNTSGATAFVSFGAFWWSFALFVLFLQDKVPAAFGGRYLFPWGVFTLYVWVATWKSPRAAGDFPCTVDHLFPAGSRRVDRYGRAQDGWRLWRPADCRAGVLFIRRRRHQRGASAHRAAAWGTKVTRCSKPDGADAIGACR